MSANSLFLVVGGSGGIGQAICAGLKARGYVPIVGYQRMAEDAARIAAATGGVAAEIDLASPESIQALPDRIAALNRPLAGIIFASSPPPDLTPFGKIESEILQRHLQVNVVGTQTLLAVLVRQFFRKQKQGIVGGILTQAMGNGIGTAMAGMGAYTIGKYGFLGVLTALSADYPWLTVRTISPGYTETPMLNTFDERFLQMQRAHGAFSTAPEIATTFLNEIFPNEP